MQTLVRKLYLVKNALYGGVILIGQNVMKRYYVMIEAGRVFDDDSHLYKFRVGKSVRDREAVKLIQKYAVEHHFYFSEWTVPTRDFIFRLAGSINRSFLQLNWVYIDLHQLARCIRECNSLPRKHYLSSHEATVRRMLGYLIPKQCIT